MKSLSLIVVLLAPVALHAAGSSALGGTFAESAMGTRPLGMGGAFVAVADDANAVQENPAGMAFIDKTARLATFTHTNLFNVGFLSRDFLSFKPPVFCFNLPIDLDITLSINSPKSACK